MDLPLHPKIVHLETAGERFVWAAKAVLLLAIAGAAVRHDACARRTAVATTLGALLVLVLSHRTGEAGGRLVHQHGAANAYVVPAR